ncbi:hypothetical protein [Actinoplanes utahensis]|uniref:hypothetical protein n=1 Tax=Actinoplanes utahensis TaxID=1869 RepID=UPI0005BA4CDA|nr:hypothetical protein [Actinoplanes utahensis]GIF29722.1 hypothetical protein Aut01nite_27080 [Actinoplanes utahensis]
MTPLAHGVGSAENLPLPLDLVLQAGAATVVLSFLIAAFWWRTPRLRPSGPRSFGITRWLRYPVLALTLYITGYAIAGPRTAENPAAHALFVWLWVGLVLVSVLFGPVWRTVNPLRTLFTLLGLPSRGLRPLPAGHPRTSWPAAAFLLIFVWFELVAPHHGDPVTVGLFLLAYAVSQLALATLRGEEWFARGDCFETYSDLAGRLSPFRWRQPLSGLVTTHPPVLVPPPPDSGRPAADISPPDASSPTAPKNPVRAVAASGSGGHSPAVAATPPPTSTAAASARRTPLAAAGLAAFVAVWWGSTVFDSVSASPLWSGFVDRAGSPLLWGTAGLALLCTLVFLAVRWTAGRLDVTMSLIPIAAGYTLAHYLSLLIVEAPRGLLLLVGASPDRWTVTPAPSFLAAAQIVLILIGHVLGVIVAHDDALATSLAADPARPSLAVLADELPLVLFMIGCTWSGLFLLFVR